MGTKVGLGVGAIGGIIIRISVVGKFVGKGD